MVLAVEFNENPVHEVVDRTDTRALCLCIIKTSFDVSEKNRSSLQEKIIDQNEHKNIEYIYL